jgi:RNA polymerase sigma-70 factor, ECF subfamily
MPLRKERAGESNLKHNPGWETAAGQARMDEQQEREVARGLRAGEAGAWRALYDAHAERVWRSVARLLGPDSADVADVVQETFLAAARSARTYDASRGTLWLWLWGIARNQVAVHYRKEKRQDRAHAVPLGSRHLLGQVQRCLQGEEAAPPDVLAAAELATLVRATLTELPADYETLLTARYLDGIPVDDIASQEQSTAVAVRSKLARARQAFRQLLLRHSVFANAKGSP